MSSKVRWGPMLYEFRHRWGGTSPHALDECAGMVWNLHPEDYAEFMRSEEVLRYLRAEPEPLTYMGFEFHASDLIPEGVAFVVRNNRCVGTVNLDEGVMNIRPFGNDETHPTARG